MKKSFRLFFFLVFALSATSAVGQNVTVEIDGDNIYYTEPGCDDCNSSADPRWRNRVVVNGASTDWNYDRDNISCGWQGVTNYAWVNPTTVPSNAGIQMQLNGFESDGFICGGDDNSCGGLATTSSVTINTNAPCTWHYFTDTRNCGSGTYGVQWSYYWRYNSINAGSISGTQTICAGGDPTTLGNAASGSTWVTYQWQYSDNSGGSWTGIGGATGLTYDPPSGLTVTRWYRRVASTCGGATDQVTNTIVVTVNPLPVATATPSSNTICSGLGAGITLSSSLGGTTYTWTASGAGPVSGQSAGSGGSINQTLVNTGSVNGTATYTVTPAASGCPGGPTTVAVTVKPIPVATATNSATSICSGQSSSISLSSNVTGSTFAYTATASSASIGGFANGSGNSIAQQLTNSGSTDGTVTYTITPTANGCVGSAIQTVVTVKPLPSVVLTPNVQTICTGQPTAIALSSPVAGSTFAWTASGSANASGFSNNSGTSISQTLSSNNASNATVTYVATATANGCIGSASNANVTVLPAPNGNISGSTTICAGQSTTLTFNFTAGDGPYDVTYNPGNIPLSGIFSGHTVSVSPSSSTTYSLASITDLNGCGRTSGFGASASITVNQLPTATATPASQSICSGQATAIVLSSTLGATSYTWTASASAGTIGGFSNSSGSTIAQTLTNSGTAPGTVTYVVTPSASSCPGASINVVVTVNPIPAVTATPSSDVICAGETTSNGLTSAVSGATFSWTVNGTPGTGGFSAASGSSITQTLTNSTVTAGTVTYTVTPAANSCPGSSIQVPITVNPSPNVIATPSSQTICSGDNATINLTSSVSGTQFNWTTSASSGAVTGHTSGTGSSISQVLSNSGLALGTVTYTITPVASGCSTTAVNATVSVNPLPNGSISGISPVCLGDQTTLTFAFNPGTGPFDVSYTDGIGIFTQSGIVSGATVSLVPPTTVTYNLLNITDLTTSCVRTTGFTGGASVAVNPLPSVNFSGLSASYCVTSSPVVLTGNQAPNGVFTGPGVTDNGNGTASFNPAVAGVGGPYNIVYDYSDINTCSGSNTQTVSVDAQPVANAGTSVVQCDLDFTFNATPSVGTGTWTASGPGIAFYDSVNGASSGVQVSVYGTYTFTWTETNGQCSDVDQVLVTFTEQPLANAGQNATSCDLSYSLSALASVGVGTWTQLSGPGTALFTAVNSSTSDVTVSQYGQYEFQWEEVNGACSDAATVIIDFYEQPAANAGFGGNECDLDFTLAAVASSGVGVWTVVGPGAVAYAPSANDPNATVTVSAYGSYVFTWTEVNGTCSSSDDVTVSFFEQPTADAGTGGSECDLNFTFSGTAGLGSGVWSHTGPGNAFYGNSNDPATSVTVDVDGVYTFTWTQTNGVCSTQDQVTVSFYQQPVADAGNGGDACDLDFAFSAVASVGTGTWTQTSGLGTSSFDNSNSPSALVTVSQYGTYTFTWTEVNGTCSDSELITVNFYDQPIADAGVGGDECDLDFSLSALPSVGSGVWTQTSGAGTSVFISATSASTVVTVDQYGTYTYTWTETNGSCSSSDVVNVNYYEQPTANAGQGGDECDLTFTFNATLSTGNGLWSQTLGSGTSAFSDPSSPTATVTVTQNDTYVFTWTETNGTCSDAATVSVNFWNQPVANAGQGGSECDLDFALNAAPSLGTGVWTAAGPGSISFISANSANTTATVSQIGTYTFTWTETNGTCVSSDDISVTFYDQPVADAGNGGTECDLDFTFNGALSVGTGSWTFSGPGTAFFSNVNDPASSVTVNVYGTYQFTWTETNGVCSDAASITVNFYEQPVADAGAVADQCDLDLTFGAAASVGIGTWTYTGPGTASFVPDANTANATVTVSQYGAYTFTWTEDNLGCNDAATVSVNFNALPVVSFSGLASSYCVDQTSVVQLTGTPAGGSYSGLGISNSVFIPSVAGVGTHAITYTYTDANGCTDSEAQNVDVNAIPVVSFSGLSSAYCTDETTLQVLTPSPAGGTFSGDGISGDSFIPSTAGVGSHIITYAYTDPLGCSGSTQQTVVVNALPVVSFTGLSAAYCEDATVVNLVASPVGATFSGAGIAGNQFDPAAAGVGTHVITCSFTDANGCSSSVTQSVTINALPQPVITPSGTQTICDGSTLTLDAGTGYALYDWNTGQNGQTITVGEADSYRVTVTTSEGCVAISAPVQVNVNALPIVDLGNDTTICTGTFLTLDAGNTGLDHLWSTLEITQQIIVGTTGNYSVAVTDGNGCVGTDDVLVAVSSTLTPTIVAGGPTTFCQGQSVTLSSEAVYTGYLWSTGANGSSISVNEGGSVTLTVTDQFGCSGTSAPTVVTVNQLPNAVVVPNGSTNLCPGASVTLEASSTFNNYSWNPGGQNTASIVVSAAGSYSVTVVDPVNGCSATSAPVVVTQSQGATPVIVANGPLEFCVGDNVVLGVEPTGAFTSYLWTSGSPTPTITVTASGSYGVQVLDINGCLNNTLITNPLVVTVWDPNPIIVQNGPTLSVSNGPFSDYQWFRNGSPLPGAINDNYTPEQSGNFTVQVTDANGCEDISSNIEFTFGVGIEENASPYEVRVYPSPNNGQFTIEAELGTNTDVTLIVKDMMGRELMSPERISGASTFRRSFDISHLSNGVYYVQVIGIEGFTVRPVVKQ